MGASTAESCATAWMDVTAKVKPRMATTRVFMGGWLPGEGEEQRSPARWDRCGRSPQRSLLWCWGCRAGAACRLGCRGIRRGGANYGAQAEVRTTWLRRL